MPFVDVKYPFVCSDESLEPYRGLRDCNLNLFAAGQDFDCQVYSGRLWKWDYGMIVGIDLGDKGRGLTPCVTH